MSRPRICRARSIARTCGSASRSLPPVRSRTSCSQCCCSREPTWREFRASLPCWPTPATGTAAAAAGIRAGDVVVALDGEPVKSWQDLRWRLMKAQGRDSVALAIQPAGPHAGDPPVMRTLSIAKLTASDWEGNALATLGLRTDLGPPVIAELVAGKPGQRAGLEAGDRIVTINDVAVRSPSDVAAITNARPGVAAGVRHRARRRGAGHHGHAGSAGARRPRRSASRASSSRSTPRWPRSCR